MLNHDSIVATIVRGVGHPDRRIAAAAASLVSRVPEDSIKKQTTQLVYAITARQGVQFQSDRAAQGNAKSRAKPSLTRA